MRYVALLTVKRRLRRALFITAKHGSQHPVQGSDTEMGDLDRNAILRMNDQNAVHALIR